MCASRPRGLLTLSSHGPSAFELGRECVFLKMCHPRMDRRRRRRRSKVCSPRRRSRASRPPAPPPCRTPTDQPHRPPPRESSPVVPRIRVVPPRAWPCRARRSSWRGAGAPAAGTGSAALGRRPRPWRGGRSTCRRRRRRCRRRRRVLLPILLLCRLRLHRNDRQLPVPVAVPTRICPVARRTSGTRCRPWRRCDAGTTTTTPDGKSGA